MGLVHYLHKYKPAEFADNEQAYKKRVCLSEFEQYVAIVSNSYAAVNQSLINPRLFMIMVHMRKHHFNFWCSIRNELNHVRFIRLLMIYHENNSYALDVSRYGRYFLGPGWRVANENGREVLMLDEPSSELDLDDVSSVLSFEDHLRDE